MTRLFHCSPRALLLLPAAVHAADVPGRGALLQILTPERGIGFNEGEVGPVGAVGRLVSEWNGSLTQTRQRASPSGGRTSPREPGQRGTVATVA